MGIVKSLYTQELIRRDVLMEDGKMGRTDVTLIQRTARAVLVTVKVIIVKTKIWIPRSRILEPDPIELDAIELGSKITLLIPLWLAKRNNLTYKETKL